MEERDAYRHHEGHLLGGGGSGSGPSRRASYKEGPGHLEFQTGRYQERELGEVVWKPSWSSLGGGHLPTGLQSDFKRRAASLPGGAEGAGFYKGSLDEQSGGCRNSDGSRGRVAEAPVARKRACQAEEDRGRQRSWGASRGHLVRKLRRRKEEAEEKEEEGQGEGCRDEEPGSPLCHNRSRPKAGGAEESQEKSKAPYKEEKQEGVNGLVRELVGDIRYRQLRGRRRSAIRRRSSSKKGMEEEPGGVDVEYIGADAAGGGHHVRPDVGPGPQLSASNFQPVLEAGLAEQDERPPWQGVANALLPARLALAGQGGSCVRRGDPEAQRSGTDLSWRTLQHRPEAGVGAAGLPSDDNSNRSTGGQQDSARGVEGKEPFKPPLGKETRVGEEIRGAKGKRQDKGQRQVKGKRRSSSSRRSQQRGSREEVEASPECGPWVRGHGSVWKPPMGLMGRNGGESAGSGMREGELVGSGGDGWELEDSGEAQQWSAAMRGDSTASPVVGEDNGPSRFPDTGGDPIFHTPPHAPTGAEGVGHFRVSPEGKSFAEMAGHFHQMFSFFRAGSDFVHSRVQCSGEVFPLPENLTVLSSQVGHLSADGVVVLQALCSALNSYYGVAGAKQGPLTVACQSALQAMGRYADDWSRCPEKFEGLSWDRFLQVSYRL